VIALLAFAPDYFRFTLSSITERQAVLYGSAVWAIMGLIAAWVGKLTFEDIATDKDRLEGENWAIVAILLGALHVAAAITLFFVA